MPLLKTQWETRPRVVLENIRWACFDRERLRFYALGGERREEYVEVERSIAFPFLAPGDLDRFLAMAGSMSETRVVALFRDWIRATLAGR